jgi:hypothetical protein
MTPEHLLNQCKNGVHILHESHYIAAKHYERLGRFIGLIVIGLSACTGTAVLQRLPIDINGQFAIILGTVSFIVSALSAVQTFLAYPALAERHKIAAYRYGEVRREIELIRTFATTDSQLESQIRELQRKWNEVDKASPTVPQRILKKAPVRIKRRRIDLNDSNRLPQEVPPENRDQLESPLETSAIPNQQKEGN